MVQVDEANLPGSPDEWHWAAAAINRVLDAVKTTPAVHLCFGNYGGQSIQKGAWEKLIDYLNALHVDHIVMETAHRPPEELAVFRDLRPEIGFGLGVIDVKSTVIESADAIARTIERAESVLGAGRVRYVHPDCGFWMLKRNIADGKMRALVRGAKSLRRASKIGPLVGSDSDQNIAGTYISFGIGPRLIVRIAHALRQHHRRPLRPPDRESASSRWLMQLSRARFLSTASTTHHGASGMWVRSSISSLALV